MKRFAYDHRGDATACVLLFAAVCVVFREAALDPDSVPNGVDLLQHYARESVFRRALAAGELPWWNPFEFSGFPLQADPQVGTFYPPNVLLRWLPLPAFLTWTVIVHVWLFGAASYALCRQLGVTRVPATIAALGLMLGGVVMPRVYAGHLDVLRTLAWIPLTLAVAFQSLDRARGAPGTLVVVVLACQLLAGFVQLVAYTLACIGLYACFSIWWPAASVRSRRHATLAAREYALLLLLVAAVTAFQVVPTVRLIVAGGRVSGVPYDEAAVPAVGFEELIRFVIPPLGDTALASETWETSAYISVLLAVLAPIAFGWRSQRRTVWFLALLAACALAFASGGPLYRLHHMLFPMFRIPGRLVVFWAIPVAVLGALALDRLTRPPARHGVAGSVNVRRGVVTAALLLAGGIVWTDATLFARQYVQTRSVNDRFLRGLPFTPTRGGRVLSLCENRIHTLDLAALGIPSVDGYNSYYLSDYVRMIHAARGSSADTFTPAGARLGAVPTLPDMTWVNRLNVTEILSCEPIARDDLPEAGRWGQIGLYRNLGAAGRVRPVMLERGTCDGDISEPADDSRPASPDASVGSLEADRSDGRMRFLFSASQPHLLYLSEPYYPERRAFVDGVERTLLKANVGLSAVCVEAGHHLVELRYVPSSLRIGTAISAVTVLLWLGVPLTRRARRRRTSPGSESNLLSLDGGADQPGVRTEDDLHRHE